MTGFKETGDITHEMLTADSIARSEIVKEKYNITTLYGWHLTPKQAHDVIECIDDNSIVFVEGYMRERSYATMRLAQHIVLAGTRLESGTYEADAVEKCEALATEFLVRKYSAPTEHDFHSYTLYTGLLEKGCIVLPADYLNLDESTPELIALDDLQEELRSLFPVKTDKALEQAIELDVNLHANWLSNQVTREQMAFNLVLYFLNEFVNTEGIESLAKTTEGKTKVYVSFGLAHRDSLTTYFAEHGIPVERQFVNSGDTPVEELGNLAVELTQSLDEQRIMTRNYYLGLIATHQEV